MCTENTARRVCQAANTVRVKADGALSVRVNFLVIWFGVIFFNTQTTVIFGDQDISKCLQYIVYF